MIQDQQWLVTLNFVFKDKSEIFLTKDELRNTCDTANTSHHKIVNT